MGKYIFLKMLINLWTKETKLNYSRKIKKKLAKI